MKFYIIQEHRWHYTGFFARYSYVLEHLLRMQTLEASLNEKIIPIIDYKNIETHYRDKDNTEDNEWNYVFYQDYKVEDVYDKPHILSDGLFYGLVNPQGKNFRNREVVSKMNWLINKYIKVRPEVFVRRNLEIENYKTLGVHCRRSDLGGAHPNIALEYTNEFYFEKVTKIFNEGNFEKVYLATEEIEIINFFLERMPDSILYQDCFRINRYESTFKDSDRFMHKTLQCRECFVDGYNLSKCHSLLCGISGVSNGAIYMNGLNYDNVFYFDEIWI